MKYFRIFGHVLVILLVAGRAWAAEPPSSPSAPAAATEKRLALIVGIGAYRFAPALANPPNDARAMAATLRKLGFEVDERLDLDFRDLTHALREFGIRAAEADVAMVYFAGHGIQVGGQNYLIPADAKLQRVRDLLYEALPLNLVLGELAQAKVLGILVLDACRNNPFIQQLAASAAAGRPVPVQAGLARVEDTPSDTLVAMATRADAVAEDGSGRHSPYAAALLKHLEIPGLELSLFFRRVRDAVLKDTNGRQEPFIFGSLGATPFYFNPLPANRNPEIAAVRPVEVLDTAPSTSLGIARPRDPDDDRLFAQVAGLPRGGNVLVGERVVLIGDYLTLDQLTAATFKPDGSLIGDAGRFEFSVMDGRGGAARGGVPVTVTASNRPPVVMAEPTLRASRHPLGFGEPVDPDGDPLVITVTAVPDRGRVRNGEAVVRPGDRLSPKDLAALTYDPGDAAAGLAGRFAVVIEDPRGAKAQASIDLEVVGGEDGRSGSTVVANHAAPPPVAAAPPPVVAAPPPQQQRVAALPAPPQPPRPQTPPPNGAPRAHGGANAFQDCPECPVMVRIPPGQFVMGDDKGNSAARPSHQVTIAKSFSLGMYEVTVAQWRACVEAGGCKDMPRLNEGGDTLPVHNIHWEDAQAYVKWLSQRTGQRYRLPSEAEWEYAARAGSKGRYWWGDEAGKGKANCEDCGGAWQRLVPVTVGSFPPNPFGLHDMLGGVAEWVADCWYKDFKSAPADGSAWERGTCRQRVLRGGSWRHRHDEVTVTSRLPYDQDVRYFAHGLRVARDLN